MTPQAEVAARNDALLAWYEEHQRDLPWRRTTDPYPVLVSELMLQQTQAARVVPLFESFMERWPTVEDLASADAAEILAAWSGLGYNRRAVRLRQTARRIADEGWPTSAAGLAELPGVGPYTAGAIASISFGEAVPAVDTNLRRVISRWEGEPLEGRSLRDAAAQMVGDPAGNWNQAIMDLGASVCRPREPRCGGCPVNEWCTDPAVYTPPPRQAAFEGSRRQLRGALVRAHLAGEDLLEIGLALGRSEDEVRSAVGELDAEGLLPTREAGTVSS